MAKKKQQKKPSGTIRVLKFKVIHATKEEYREWKSIAEQVKRMTNACVHVWLREHMRLGNEAVVRQYMADKEQWHADNPDKSKYPVRCDVKGMTSEIQAEIWEYLQTQFVDNGRFLYSQIPAIVLQFFKKRLNAKATKSAYPKWMRILAFEGELPNSARPLPIPFDCRHAAIIGPTKSDKDFYAQLKLVREVQDGKAVTKVHTVKLQTRGKKVASQAGLLRKIAEGLLELKGSNLAYRESTNEWFVNIAYEMPKPEKANVDPSKTAMLVPGSDHPFTLEVDGEDLWIGGGGGYIASIRRQLLTQRLSYSGAYRHASSARKGHGRKRAVGKVHKLSNRWKDFVKTFNETAARQTVQRCVDRGAGRLVYLQGDNDTKLFCNTAGKEQDKRDSTGWDWFQLKTLLERRCAEVGIEFESEKMSEVESVA